MTVLSHALRSLYPNSGKLGSSSSGNGSSSVLWSLRQPGPQGLHRAATRSASARVQYNVTIGTGPQ
jgi:hypothetical protein